ncbi:hypothetical protein RMCBS344292_17115 [Rhizopus microsporus]|nr:hypothetical protein RMCBS344292_17115 [Rhizopus microsporus]
MLLSLLLWCPLIVNAFMFPKHLLNRQSKSIVAFGDSYTDYGVSDMYYESIKNHYNKSKSQIPVALPKRWSDGHLWIEYLKEMMSAENIYDFARSGATVNNVIYTVFSNLSLTHFPEHCAKVNSRSW